MTSQSYEHAHRLLTKLLQDRDVGETEPSNRASVTTTPVLPDFRFSVFAYHRETESFPFQQIWKRGHGSVEKKQYEPSVERITVVTCLELKAIDDRVLLHGP